MFLTIKNVLGKRKTFKEIKNPKEDSKQFVLLQNFHASLGKGVELFNLVKLPEGEDINEWLATNVFDFYNTLNLLYGPLTDYCTEKSCPIMSAGPKYEYLWADYKDIKKPIKVSAPQYINHLMAWIENILEDENIFPTEKNLPFPKNFLNIVKTIFKRLFRVYAHMYLCHLKDINDLDLEPHLNTSFKHFYIFVQEFDLVDTKEMIPMQAYIDKLLLTLQKKQ